ncbi:DAK2 domain-containing protein [Peptoniphilus sp. oral taxon 386]|uniref:DAK2 domain-containing protein n=1 Tax=Peptoniphilus sp. oral taxon 386 TaxID=652713 RepID=UPI0001DAA424|nr:DAK2 domain-containing protein [Peptoniphilus sp. oral taxon 386]EFI41330.1 DAK2 domain fusion protein YloV [Peptoniphilus sp. oral taxon 386 str. F0131]
MRIERLDGILLKKAINGAVNYLILNKDQINALNVFPVPDGDTGTNMSLTAKSSLKQVGLVENEKSAYEIAKAAARGSLMGARGNSGVILSQLLRGFSEGINGLDEVCIEELALAFKKASETTYNAVMKPTEGTILTVGRETADFSVKNYKNYHDILEFLKACIEEANKSLDKTPELLKVLKDAGVVDAGGKGLVTLLEGAYKALMGEEIIGEEDDVMKKKAQKEINFGPADESIKYGYCTEFIINTDYEDIESFKSKLAPLGDCLLVVGGAGTGLIKVHVHTNHPGKALEYAVELGGLQDIKIDNMRYQHREVLFNEQEVENARQMEQSQEEAKEDFAIDKDYSFIAVSMGDGMSDVFNSLGVDYIVEGGQTMNPSTEDFLNAVDKVRGNDVFIIPNNSNIILAAEQAQKLSERNIHVIPSKSVPQGISALLAFNSELNADENKSNMTDALELVVSAQVTYAVRDTQMNGKDITTGDIIGLSGKEILSCGKDVNDVTKELIESLVNDEISMITLYRGEDTQEELSEKLVEELQEEYSDLDIDVIYGGQPLYYYIISLE